MLKSKTIEHNKVQEMLKSKTIVHNKVQEMLKKAKLLNYIKFKEVREKQKC